MKNIALITGLLLSSLPLTAAEKADNGPAKKPVTLKQIMAHPDWMGVQPTNWRWAADSQSVLYRQRRSGGVIEDIFRDGTTASDSPSKIALADHYKVANQQLTVSPDDSMEAYVFNGNLFVRDRATKAVTQLTRSQQVESSPLFLTDGRLAFRIGNSYKAMTLATQAVVDLATVKDGKKPNVKVKDPKSYVAKEQHKLIDYIQQELDKKKTRAAHKEKAKAADPTAAPTPFYVGKGYSVDFTLLSPSGTKLFVVATTPRPKRAKSDIMPHYIQPDASVKAVSARQRVGTFKFASQKYLAIDLTTNTVKEIDIKDLKGFDEDVLAAVRKENHKRNGEKYKSKKEKRITRITRAVWSRDGAHLAVFVRTVDNKDRWTATVDFDKGEFIQHQRLHDDAWVNSYAGNDMGWAGDHKTLYFQSERDGYAHIYAVDVTKNKRPRQLTKGNYVTRSLAVNKAGDHIYFAANVDHPGSYNIYRVAVSGGDVEQMSAMGGLTSFRLSPDDSKLLIQQSSRVRPNELFVQNNEPMAKPVKISSFTSEEFLSYDWQVPEVVEVAATTHKRPIYARVYRPEDDGAQDKKRGVMFIHGAGYLQNAHKGFSGYFREFMFHQLLIQKGYVVMDMDWRASAGYGRDWRTAIYRQMGTPELEDIKDGVNWMVKNENVDPKRVGGYGGSYGGFLTLMTLFNEPDLLAAGSALRLVSDWTSYNHGYTSNILNTPSDDPIAYERSSPIYFAEGLKKPLLINAPMVDSNVFFQDGVRLVQRLIELEKTEYFETAIFPVENHGFTEPSSWLDEYKRILALFENNL